MQYIDLKVFEEITKLKEQKGLEASVDKNSIKIRLYVPVDIVFNNSMTPDFFIKLVNLLKEQAYLREFEFIILEYANIKNMTGVMEWRSQSNSLIEKLKQSQQYFEINEWRRNNLTRQIAEKKYKKHLPTTTNELKLHFLSDCAALKNKTTYHPFDFEELFNDILEKNIDFISLQKIISETKINKTKLQFNCILYSGSLNKTLIYALENSENMEYEQGSLYLFKYKVLQAVTNLDKLKSHIKHKSNLKNVNDCFTLIFAKMAMNGVSPEFLGNLIAAYESQSKDQQNYSDVNKLILFLNEFIKKSQTSLNQNIVNVNNNKLSNTTFINRKMYSSNITTFKGQKCENSGQNLQKNAIEPMNTTKFLT